MLWILIILSSAGTSSSTEFFDKDACLKAARGITETVKRPESFGDMVRPPRFEVACYKK